MRALVRGASLALPLLLLASACSGEPEPPGAVTADEERQLNEAAAMLDANSIAIDDLAADNTAREEAQP